MSAKVTEINPTGMYGRVEMFTQERALQALAKSKGNRYLRKGRIARYKADRIGGNWTVHHQGVAFDTNGEFIDGHHRMTMVAETGLPTVFFVVYNVPVGSVVHVDEQLPRSVADAIKMAGRGDFKNSMVATANILTVVPGRIGIHANHSREELCDILVQYADALEFSENFRGHKLVSRAVRVLLARAWLARPDDRDTIKAWGDSLCSRQCDNLGVSNSASAYRKLLEISNGKGHGNETDRYRKGQWVLAALLNGESIPSRLYATEKDLFPLPVDPDQEDEYEDE